jgi:condensin complex subunit 1
VAPIAEAVAFAEQRYNDSSLAVALIREIGRADPKDYARFELIYASMDLND